MNQSIPANVKPEILEWARTSALVPIEDAVLRLKMPVDQWEKGDGKPSIAELRKLADLYKRPLAVFFLSEVPDFPVMSTHSPESFQEIAGV